MFLKASVLRELLPVARVGYLATECRAADNPWEGQNTLTDPSLSTECIQSVLEVRVKAKVLFNITAGAKMGK